MARLTQENQIFFYSTLKNEFKFLSNFWRTPMVADGLFYSTNEAYFQSKKTTDRKEELKIGRMPRGVQALVYGRRVNAEDIRTDWEQVKVTIMLNGLRHKFAQNRALTEMLLATGDAILIEASPRDKFWGWADGKGQNMLGQLLMQVRDELRSHDPRIVEEYRAMRKELEDFLATHEGYKAMQNFKHQHGYMSLEEKAMWKAEFEQQERNRIEREKKDAFWRTPNLEFKPHDPFVKKKTSRKVGRHRQGYHQGNHQTKLV